MIIPSPTTSADYDEGYEDARRANFTMLLMGLFLGNISAFCLAYSWGWFS